MTFLLPPGIKELKTFIHYLSPGKNYITDVWQGPKHAFGIRVSKLLICEVTQRCIQNPVKHLTGMLHVGEVKFTTWWNSTAGWHFFEIHHEPFNSGWKMKILTSGWIRYFDLSVWYFKCFHFIKIRKFQVITDKRSVISGITSYFTITWNGEK